MSKIHRVQHLIQENWLSDFESFAVMFTYTHTHTHTHTQTQPVIAHLDIKIQHPPCVT